MTVTVCQGIDDIKRLIMLDGCLSVKSKDKIMAELCCLKEMSLPITGFKRISDTLVSGATMDLFDNAIDSSPSPPSTALQVRAIFFCASYPSVDSLGVALPDVNKSMVIRIYDANLNSIDLPMYNFFGITTNTVTADSSMVINKIQLVNPNTGIAYNITIEGLLLLTDKEGVKITRATF